MGKPVSKDALSPASAKFLGSCAQAGGLTEAVTISIDMEQLISEAGRLHDAASLLNRPYPA